MEGQGAQSASRGRFICYNQNSICAASQVKRKEALHDKQRPRPDAGIVAPLLPVLGFTTPVQVTLVCMAIGAGAMTVSHANDSYFWVVTNFGAMSPDRGYKTQTMNTLVMGIAAIVEIALLSLVLH